MKPVYWCAVTLAVLLATVPGASAQGKSPTQRLAPTAMPAPVIEAKAMALLKHNQQTMLALKTYAAECRTVLTRDKPQANQPAARYMIATLVAAKPNKMRYDSWTLKGTQFPKDWTKAKSAPGNTFACDGKNSWKQFGNLYQKDDRTSAGSMNTILEPWNGFYTLDDSPYGSAVEYQKKKELREARLVGSETVEGIPCEKVSVAVASSYGEQKYEPRAIWYFGQDSLVRRCVSHVSFDDAPGITRESVLSRIRINSPINPAVYRYTPPAGVKLRVERTRPALLANGVSAPDFSAMDARKKPVKLSSLRGKVVVVDFWASWCGPCMASMPHNQEVMKKLQAQGLPVVLIAVDDGESRETFDAWIKGRGASFSAVTFVHSPPSRGVSGNLFRVSGIPTQYVLDKRGVVRASFVGFGGPSEALEQAVRAAANSR